MDYDTSDTTNRCATDTELREHGFTIHSRPERGEPVWKKNGVLYPQSRAQQWVETEVAATASR